jgi:hypothetical protein
MLKLEYSPSIAYALMKAYPKYTLQKANSKIEKYVKTLERLMRRAKLNKVSKRSKKKKTYELEATVLWDKTGQLGSDKIRIHQWLLENRFSLVINTNPNHKPSKELAEFKPTKYLIIKNESLLDLMRSMTDQERNHFLDSPSKDDIDEINDYLKDFHALSSIEQSDKYDLVEVDIESVKNYLKKLCDGQVFIDYKKQESDADCAEYILRIAQLNNRQLPQLKDKSDFGDAMNMFDGIDESELQNKLNETFSSIGDFFKNMEGKDFLHLLHHADCLIGNSSVGIRECAYLGVPVVNIGSRQNRRDRGSNVVDVTYEAQAIKEAIKVQSVANRITSDVYGGGDAGNQIAYLLAHLPLQFHKSIMY